MINEKGEEIMYELYNQETGEKIGNLVKTTRAAERIVTLLHKKNGKYPDYRRVIIKK
jgi:hypothetical protein